MGANFSAITSNLKKFNFNADPTRFGKEFDESEPISTTLPITVFGEKLLHECKSIKTPNSLEIDELIKNSNAFSVQFPIDSCRIHSQPEDEWNNMKEQASSAYPLVHERVIWLLLRFLEHKLNYGTPIEKEVYHDMNVTGLVQRLLTKRCATFVGHLDAYYTRSGEEGLGNGIFENIGTEKETSPFILKDYMSYDEMKLSALLSISSYSKFLNDGNRKNTGKIEEDKNNIENSGIVISLTGPRLHRLNVMEYQEIIITEVQNTPENGYGKKNEKLLQNSEIVKKYDYRQMWNEFYNATEVSFRIAKNGGNRFTKSWNRKYIIDNLLMKKRYTVSFDTLLLESEARAATKGARAYIHVVGLGLGAWKSVNHQEELFLRTFSERLHILLPKLNHISFVHFSWFQLTVCDDLRDGGFIKNDDHPDGGIKIFISRRNPAEKLNGPEFNNVLLIVSYAGDSNTFPGNEFWMGSLETSSDPAAACSTLITELHNAYINKTKVSGDNLHVASPELGVLHIAEYAKQILKNN